MFDNSLTGLDRKQLRWLLALFFVALAVPTGVLVYQAYSQLKWEAFHQYQGEAEELAARIDKHFIQIIDTEEARSFADFTFLNVAGDPAANFLQRSPLSAYPVASTVPGLIGYFQVDSEGDFSTPLLPQPGADPADYGVSGEELEQRHALQEHLQQILSRNRLVQGDEDDIAGGKTAVAEVRQASEPRRDRQAGPEASRTLEDREFQEELSGDRSATRAAANKPEEPAPGQAAFDRLNKISAAVEPEKKQKAASQLGRVEDLKLDYRYQAAPADERQRQAMAPKVPPAEKRARKERSALPEPAADITTTPFEDAREAEVTGLSVAPTGIRIRTFESEIDPFEFSLLDGGHFVLFRKVWRDGQRYIQGALIEQQPFLQGIIRRPFDATALSAMSDLIVAWQGNVFSAFSGQASREYLSSAAELRGALLYQSRLSDPLSALELIFSITRLPAGPGGKVVTWVAVILMLVLCGGFYLMYRLGAGQIDLARQQQDFVSAISHELKTPLTSIRMYGEMLREGWASEEKKATYYDYIFDESERLSRLITNVLQLARMTRNDLQVDLKTLTVVELMDAIRSRVTSQAEHADFVLQVTCDGEAERATLNVDADWFTQIIINLVDNAIKFSARAENRVIDIGCQLQQNGKVQFRVRDYGPGIPGDQMKKIFKLFYRSESELTRETVGTGIGLALVHQLAQAMEGQVDVVNKEPGAEFRVSFPATGVPVELTKK